MKVAVIYMAAGNSRRFAMAKQKGSGQRNEGLYPGNEEKNKLLQKLEGKPLYLYGLETLAALRERHNEAEIFVITRFQEILESAGERGMKAFLNPESEKGVSHTIRRGIREAQKAGEFDYLLFVAADQPRLSLETLEKFLELGERKTFPVVSAAWRKTETAADQDGQNRKREECRLGNPVMFQASLAGELLALSGDEGGRRVWRVHASQSGLVFVKEEGELEDFDLPWETG